jgi:4-hydroxybenzoyl-CoA thioesterase
VLTASFNVDFKAPCRHGEHLKLNLTIQSMGRSSMKIQTVAVAGNETRMVADQVIVLVDVNGRSVPWPEPLREKVNSAMEDPK